MPNKSDKRKKLTPVEIDLSIPDHSIRKRKIIDLNDHTHSMVGCRAYLNTLQENLADDTDTKVLLDSETYDIGNDFAAYKFITPINGYYHIDAAIAWRGSSLTADKRYTIFIYVNGVSVASASIQASFVGALSSVISDTVYLNKDDYVELYANQASGGALVDISNTESGTYMTIHLLQEV